MKVIASLLPFLALALQGTSAAPTEPINIPVPLGTKADIVLRVCDHENFGGRCENLRSQSQRCYNLGNGWQDTISSARTDAGKNCYLYEHNNCQGRHVELVGGGTGHQNLARQNFNDVISSYRCSD